MQQLSAVKTSIKIYQKLKKKKKWQENEFALLFLNRNCFYQNVIGCTGTVAFTPTLCCCKKKLKFRISTLLKLFMF